VNASDFTRVISQSADLRLRGSLRARVTWPPATSTGPSPLLLLLAEAGESEALSCELCVGMPAVVLTVSGAGFDQAVEALEWGADHAGELGSDPERLLVAGAGSRADLAERLARHARDRGWPLVSLASVALRSRAPRRA
jgi:hypothetical protein